ncbi:phosphoadenosine phosphosulfate reductase family protein [Virgibacillus sp. Bac332]|uniref:phosphoadenosine phosphosulfate reductase domain-containing protein n=1 Tax=Virgibacillus sp. Bac332 TaxID=2419842 RepID=UPI000EF48814|nr:phosphoadenosine phosphosulfate reductase family protein [Virgibacillus sp. Bac332]
MIQKHYDDGQDHIHVLSFGGGTQSSALLLMALKGEINGVIPDYIIFSDTGWEPQYVYDWVDKLNKICIQHNQEIIFASNGNIRTDILESISNNKRFASLPFFTKDAEGKIGMARRQCTNEYKIVPIRRKIRELLGYKKGERVKEVVHVWKGISTDEVQRVKPMREKWQIAEHPLIEVVNMDRTACISYVERQGLGTPAKSSCIGCPFHDDGLWRDMKKNDPKSFKDAVYIDRKIKDLPRFKGQAYLHRSGKPLDEVDFQENQMEIFDFINECEGMCGV